jgi:hypothetical protein
LNTKENLFYDNNALEAEKKISDMKACTFIYNLISIVMICIARFFLSGLDGVIFPLVFDTINYCVASRERCNLFAGIKPCVFKPDIQILGEIQFLQILVGS